MLEDPADSTTHHPMNGKADTHQPQGRIPEAISAQYKSWLDEDGRNTAHARNIRAYLLAAQDKPNTEICETTGYKSSSLSKHVNKGHELAVTQYGLPSLWGYAPEHRMIRRKRG